MNIRLDLGHGTIVAVCLGLGLAATVVDLVLESTGHPAFDPQPLYVFLALVLGQQGAKVSSEKSDADS